MTDNNWIILLVTIIILFTLYLLRIGHQYQTIKKDNEKVSNGEKKILEQNRVLRENNDYLQKIKFADENIFDFMRCINVPRTPACKDVDNSGICRSRQIDCNKIKLVLQNDPIAVERMKIATDQYTESNKEKNPSDLTYPVKSGWFF